MLVIAIHLGGPFEGLAEIVRVGMENSKFAFAEYMADTGELRPVGWGISLTEKTVLLMFLLGLGDWLAEYSSNQNVVQRYAACKSTKDARTAMWICCWFSVPTWGLFMFLGTALYAFYQAAPTDASIAMLTGAEKG